MIKLALFLYLAISFFVYSQNNNTAVYYNGEVYTLSIENSDVSFKRIDNYLFKLYVRKKGNINYVSLYIKDGNGNIKEAYIKYDGEKKYLRTDIIKESVNLGNVFSLLVSNIVFIDDGINEQEIRVNSIDNFIIRAFYSDNVYLDNNLQLDIKLTEYVEPRVEILDIQISDDNIYGVLLKYIGGENKDINFYYRDGYESREYNLLQPIAKYNQKDGLSIILKNTFNNGIGKEFLVQAYFEAKEIDRHLFFNAFDKNGQTETIPIQVILDGIEIEEDNSITIINEKKETENIIVKLVKTEVEEPKKEEVVEKNRVEEPEIPVKQVVNREDDTILKKEVIYVKEDDIFNKKHVSVDDFNSFPKKIIETISKKKGESLDIVFVFDVTGSMKNALNKIKKSVDDIIIEMYTNHDRVRVGFVLFRDVSDDFIVKSSGYITDRYEIKKMIYGLNAYGGGDIEEPILDALDTALTDFSFDAENKMIFVVTDAPIKESIYVTEESIIDKIKNKNIELEYLLLPIPEAFADIGK